MLHLRQAGVLDGNALMRLRKALGLRCDELARAIGVHRATLYRWEADGYVRTYHSSPGARILHCLETLDGPRHRVLGVAIHGMIARNEDEKCQAWLSSLAAGPKA